jgi:hypothetical protein
MAAIIADKMNVMDAARQSRELFRKNMAAVVVIGGVSIIAGFAMTPIMVPFFAIPFALSVEEFNRTILLVAGICTGIYLPLFAIFPGAVIAFMKSGWVLTYLRLSRSPTLQPLLQEATS